MDGASRRFVGWGVGAYLAALVLLAVIFGEGNRLPLPTWLVIAGFVVAQAGAGFVFGRWPWLLLGLCPVASALAAGARADNVLIPFLTLIFVVPPAIALTAVGIGARKLYEKKRRPVTHGRVIAVASVAPLALALAIAVIDRDRTVHADRPRPVALDERNGRLGEAGLGDSAAAVEAHLGRAPKRTVDDGTAPLDSSLDSLGSPSSIPGPPSRHDSFLRYPKSSFWLGDDRVYSIETIDPAGRTSRGVGVGDSMELVRHAYPELDCGEDSVGSDEPIPFPYCAGRTGPRTWIYFGGDYTKSGTPVTSITLLPRAFY
jgi:hypothetical protein